MGFFDKLASGLKKTKDAMGEKLNEVFGAGGEINEDFYDELEEAMILSDMGASTASEITQALRKRVRAQGIKEAAPAKELLRQIITEMLEKPQKNQISGNPAVLLIIGVNGVGKTTTIGKLAAYYRGEQKTVIIGAADTFRAAAIDQLAVWAKRADCKLISQGEGADPAAVVFDTIAAGKAANAHVVLCDTAGRLHNKKNLMDELSKIVRVAVREVGEAQVRTLLVLDATTGQNAISQAKLFLEAAGINGLILTKLDGTAKGGVVVGICNDLQVPIEFIGVGEQAEDLRPFVPQEFAKALFD